MSTQDSSVNSQQTSLMRRGALLPIFGNAASSLRAIPRQPRPLRIAVVGNHFPRQCEIATFTTDLWGILKVFLGLVVLA